MTTNLTTGKPAKVILLFTLPLLVGNVFQQMYGLADAFVVGRILGIDALAAVGSTGGITFLLLGFAWGLTTGFAIPTAQAFGAGDPTSLRRSVASGTLLTGGFAVLLTAVAVPVARPLLELLRTPPQIVDDAYVFVVVAFWGIGAIMFFNFLSSTVRALGDSRTPLVVLALSCVLNVVLVVTFVAGMGMGVEGAALATITSQLASVLFCLRFVQRTMPMLHLSRDDWRVGRADLATQLRIGLPMAFQTSIIAIGTIVLQYALNGLGTEAVGAYTAAQKVDGLAMAPLASFGLAMATFTAQNYGARAYGRIRTGVVQTCLVSVGFALVIGLVNVLLGGHLVRLFVGPDQEHVAELAQTFLVVNGSLYVALGLLFVLRNTLQGMGRSLVPTIAGVMELVTRVVAALVLAAHVGFVGVCLAAPLAWVAALVPVWISYRRQRRRLTELEQLPCATRVTEAAQIALTTPGVDQIVAQDATTGCASSSAESFVDDARPGYRA